MECIFCGICSCFTFGNFASSVYHVDDHQSSRSVGVPRQCTTRSAGDQQRLWTLSRAIKQICQRSTSPLGRFCSSSISSSSSAFNSSISGFSSQPSSFFTRSSSPTRVNLPRSAVSTSSVWFSIDNRSISVNQKQRNKQFSNQKKTCMCSPMTHPGSFRCSLHKNVSNRHQQHRNTVSYRANRLNARRSAMTNSLVRIGTVGGDLVKRALSALIRPSSHQQRRRARDHSVLLKTISLEAGCWRINSRVDMEHYCFEKVLCHTDITHTLEIPSAAAHLPGHNAIMDVWDNGGRQWTLQMATRRGERKALKSKEWLRLVRINELEEGETVRFYYIPARNSYSVQFEGPNRVQALQLFPLN